MPQFQHRASGDRLRISASDWNAVLDLARNEQARKLGAGGGSRTLDAVRPSVVVLVSNDSGSDAEQGYVLAVTDALLDPAGSPGDFLARPLLAGDTPAATDDPFVVLLEPIEDGAVGRAAVAGLAICQVNVTSTGHDYATPTAADAAKLTSGASGPARILWKETGSTGTQACVVLLGEGAASGGGSGITVEEEDGTPTYGSVVTLEVDQAQGGRVTQPSGAGTALISWANASASQAGVVSTGTQGFAGEKSFTDAVTLKAASWVGFNLTVGWFSGIVDGGTPQYGYVNLLPSSGSSSGGKVRASNNLTGAGVELACTSERASYETRIGVDAQGFYFHGYKATGFDDPRLYIDTTSGVKTGVSNTIAGLQFTCGWLTGGSLTAVTSVDASGGTTGLTVSGGPVTGTGTLTLGGTLGSANGGTGLTATPPAGTLLVGTGSGYAQASAQAQTLKWGVD